MNGNAYDSFASLILMKDKAIEQMNTDASFKVTILYFGRLRELLNTSSEKITFDSTISYTQRTILDRIIEHRPMLERIFFFQHFILLNSTFSLQTFLNTSSFRLAVDQQYLLDSDSIHLTEQSEIALLPPFGGG